jgi:cysteine-rich repeat protein
MEICGDGKRINSEQWDDGGTAPGDGWDASWTGEVGWTWVGGTPTTPDTCQEDWGDGIRFNSIITYCDDGNTISNDGWSSTCSIEMGYVWNGGTSSTADTWSSIWGDGRRVGSEGWDDGTVSDGDGWNSSCQVESGWIWSGGNPTTSDTCTEAWGDGIKFNSNSAYWDDGNTISGDGCDSSWAVEIGWSWVGGSTTTPDVCNEIWGDGILYNLNQGVWDDGNTQDGDGWSSLWTVEKDGKWTSTHGSTSVWTKVLPTAAFLAIDGVAMLSSLVASSIGCSSPNGLWQMVNIMQLFMFLILLKVYLPTPIEALITSSSYFAFTFPIIHFRSLYGIGHILELIDFKPTDSALSLLGAESGSTFINVLSQLLMLILIFILHLFALSLRNCDPKMADGRWSKWLKWTGKKNFDFFTFTVYIRLILQSSQFMLMSSIAEFYAFNLENDSYIVSLGLAGLVLLLIGVFFIIGVKFWITRVRKWAYHQESRFNEFFNGLKKTKFATSYSLLILLRRAYLILWIIWTRSMPLMLYLIGAALLQVLHASVIILIRPFNQVKDNIVEVANELVFTTLMAGLVYFNNEAAWNKMSISVYLYLSLFNSYRCLMLFPSVLILFTSICKCGSFLLF